MEAGVAGRTHGPRNGVTEQLQAVARQLNLTVGESLQMEDHTAEKRGLSAEILGLEGAIAALPSTPEYAELRSQLALRVQGKKQAITKAKPLGMRMDSAKEYMARCQHRRESAGQALVLAQAAVQAAEAELAASASDLAEVEEEARTQHLLRDNGQNAIQSLVQAASRLLEEMKGSTLVGADLIAQTEEQCRILIGGVNKIAAAATAATDDAQAKNGVPSDGTDTQSIRRRINGKQPEVGPPLDVAMPHH